MKTTAPKLCCIHAIGIIAAFAAPSLHAADPLPSWNDTGSKRAIIGFVERVTDEKSRDYVEPAERIATFDNDGTLWLEQPMYTQMVFAFDRLRQLAPDNPEWLTTEPYRAMLNGTPEMFTEFSYDDMVTIMLATHSGITSREFRDAFSSWEL